MNEPCEACGKIPDHNLHSHHAIPRYMECSDDRDIIHVCKSCHKKGDKFFEKLMLRPLRELKRGLGITIKKYGYTPNLWAYNRLERYLLDPYGRSRGLSNWHDPKWTEGYSKAYDAKFRPKIKRLHIIYLDEVVIETNIQPNIKTGNFTIYNTKWVDRKKEADVSKLSDKER